jgi:hypothetical protein
VVAGETLIIPVRDRVGDLASIYRLNSTGSLIWKLLGPPRTVTQLAMAFAQDYEVEPGMVRRDGADFLNEKRRLVWSSCGTSCDARQDSTPRRTIDTATHRDAGSADVGWGKTSVGLPLGFKSNNPMVTLGTRRSSATGQLNRLA